MILLIIVSIIIGGIIEKLTYNILTPTGKFIIRILYILILTALNVYLFRIIFIH